MKLFHVFPQSRALSNFKFANLTFKLALVFRFAFTIMKSALMLPQILNLLVLL